MADWKGCAKDNYQSGRPGQFQPEAVVIHIMDGSLTGTDAWFNNNKAKVSAHYGIGRGGVVHQYVKEADTAFHAGIVDRPTWPLLKPGVNPNFYTIGVEHEGYTNVVWPWPAPQLHASAALVREILARWRIPLERERIVPHHLIRAGKTCPGIHFDRAAYLAAVSAAPAPAVTAAPLALDVAVVQPTVSRCWPRTDSAPVCAVTLGETIRATLITSGESVQGNATWYGVGAHEFIWAGATNRPHLG
ncbi:MAG: peptidoglycan recognition family protein [Acetobacteraceae bacterium]|jgi:N-acetyl-anhydromuramyl-L-alanine amidase AmpD